MSMKCATLNVPAGHQQLVLAEGKSNLKLLQKFEELHQVALWEAIGFKHKLFHGGALNNSFGLLPDATAL